MVIIRVHELAKKYNFSNAEFLDLLRYFGIEGKSHLTGLTEEEISIILRKIQKLDEKEGKTIKGFEIKKLFNEYDYKFNFSELVNIYVAENGSGKTTILNLLVGIMTENIEKLRKIPFETISLYLDETRITLNKTDLYRKESIDFKELEFMLRRSLPSYQVRRVLERIELNNSPQVIYHLLRDLDLPSFEIDRILDRINYSFTIEKRAEEKLKNISRLLNKNIVYLPTYRRIEEELSALGLRTDNARNINMKLNTNNINFGMNDVEENIKKLMFKLKNSAIEEYSNMTAEVLDDLLNNKIKQKFETNINIDIIKIIIGRIGKDRIKETKLTKFIEGKIETENDNFLMYYLNKLISIYNANKDIDDKIKKYRDVCNFYLVNKKMYYDEVLSEVKIKKIDSDNEINFTLLSSGEKQILSLFSKLYLETNEKSIIIIDEPELSLSIEWQKRLLPDIIASGMCELLIVTTHSPFIFSNELSSYAKDLNLFRKVSK